jgi:hypothetical protein
MLIPTAMLGSLIGSRLMHRLPLRALRVVFAIFLFAAGARMVWHGYDDLSPSPATETRLGIERQTPGQSSRVRSLCAATDPCAKRGRQPAPKALCFAAHFGR